MSKFEELVTINVNDKVEKRTDGKVELSYLSWTYAWREFKKVYPDAKYEIKKFEHYDNTNFTTLVPYMFDEQTGYLVNTEITADGQTYEMWLPVMDNKNKAMKNHAYTYKTQYGEKTVEAATMFDVNKAIMRCLVKNMAMFGLGLYIYAGEDLPENANDKAEEQDKALKALSIADEIRECVTEDQLKSVYKKNKAKITSDKRLLDLITKRADEIKRVA